MLMLDAGIQKLAKETAKLVHLDRMFDAGRLINGAFKLKDPKDEPAALVSVQQFVSLLLNGTYLAEAAAILWTPAMFTIEPDCARQVWKLYDDASFGLIMGGGSLGKCMRPGELCRCADGTIKRAGDVRVGDLLAGEDGSPRSVLDVTKGRSEMFRVTPRGAPAFECNGEHVLSLICTCTRRNHSGSGGISSGYTPGKIVDVSLREYLTWGKKRKEAYRLFFGTAQMPESLVKVDPYVYGSWLGDGTRVRAEITTPDGPMAARWREYWTERGFVVESRKGDETCGTWAVRDERSAGKSGRGGGFEIWPNQWFRESVEDGEKRIKPEYLHNSEEVRLGVLAGLIDSDGHSNGTAFDITTKWDGLAEDIEKLARSLGFGVRVYSRTHTIKSLGFSAPYWHLYITGPCNKIPTLEKKIKRVSGRTLCEGHLTTSFTVESIGEGDYAGFYLDGNHRFLLASGIVTHNSYTMGARFLLEWLRDPEWTSLRIIGPSEDHLEANLFSHLVSLHKSATIPLPGEIGELWIGLDRRQQLGSIKGVVVPVGRVKKAARLQGAKRKPRPVPHPRFGALSRMFIFIDEIENVPAGIWSDIDNVMSNAVEVSDGGFKIFGAYNPTNQQDEVGKRAEPTFGWEALDPDRHFKWTSKRGWEVLRLDGERSENVIHNRVIYPGLQTRAGLEAIAKNAGGYQSPGYYSMGRGLYPPQGIALTVIPPGMLAQSRGEFIWFNDPQAVGSCDLALEGGSSAVFTIGKLGLASGIKYPPSLSHPKGRTVMFKNPQGRVVPRWGLQADQQFKLPKGDTAVMTSAIIKTCKSGAIAGHLLAVDRTGHGAGIADMVKNDWSSAIHDLNYSEGCSETKVMVEDTKTCKEEYPRVDSELWFGMRKWMEFGYFILNPQIEMSELSQQLTQRQYRSTGGKSQVESKKDYKARGYKSPDEADSLTLFVYAARKGESLILSMKGDTADGGMNGEPEEDWPGQYPNGVRIDESNRTDALETPIL